MNSSVGNANHSRLVSILSSLDLNAIDTALNDQGYALISKLLSRQQCRNTIELYDKEDLFRKKIVMDRQGYGQGEYQYFSYPLPTQMAFIREVLYSKLVPIAQQWATQLNLNIQYSVNLDAFLAHCAEHGQRRPTPLILKYGRGDYNRLHQDVYGEVGFPLQLAVCLSCPEQDFHGGEFVLTEQRARMQSRVEVVKLQRGDGVIFANRYRPTKSVRGFARLNVRHGVSRVNSGNRYCLGIIFHDAT